MATSCLFVCYVDVVVDIEPLWVLARVSEVFEHLSDRVLIVLVFVFIFARFPAGLVIYWTWSNVLSVIQQWFIMRNNKK